MRVHQITCPKCSATLKSKAGVPVGQVIPCAKCKHKFAVEDLDDADVIEDADVVDDAEVIEDFEVEEPAPPKKKGPPPVPSGKRAVKRKDEDDEDEDEDPRPKRRVSANDQAKKRRPRDDEDEDEDERPRRKKRRHDDEEQELSLYRRLRNNIAVRIITWVILLTVLAVAAYLLYEKKMAEKENAAHEAPRIANAASVADRG